MVGNSQAQCQVDGTWEAAPTCQIVSKCKPFYNVSDYCRCDFLVGNALPQSMYPLRLNVSTFLVKVSRFYFTYLMRSKLTVAFRARWFHMVFPDRTSRTALAFPPLLDSRSLRSRIV